MGRQIYFTNSELGALSEFFYRFDQFFGKEEEEKYAYWLTRTGTAQNKIMETAEKKGVFHAKKQ